MGTRSIIVVTGKTSHADSNPRTIRLYKHWDGYPSGNLPIIQEAIKRAQEQVVEYDKRFPDSYKKGAIGTDQLVGLIIGESTSLYGVGAYIDLDDENKKAWYSEKLKPKHLGGQWDLEWIYVVNVDTKNVDVYEDSFDKSPQECLKAGTSDPLMALEGMVEEAKDGVRKEILEVKKSIIDLGWTINCSKRIKLPERKIVYA